MKKFITSLIMLLAITGLVAQPVDNRNRKKVAVVLCGGGAMGAIHIGTLKVLEEAGIPIDMVTGTSMGSIIGGMYAVGYDADDIETIVNSMDWGDILRDRLSMRNQTLAEREKQNIYLFDYRLFLDKSQDTLAGGFIRGINVEKTLRHYLRQPEDIDFKKLPRPFGCIATDLVTDSEVVLDHGSLPRSIRASMAVPGVFAPVRMDPYILVDGGTKNNFPADLARRMGADIVIGVRTDLGLNDKYYSTSDILERSVGADIHNRSDENDKYCDLIIRVPVRGYSAAHFYRSAIKELIRRGEEATRAQMDSIMILKRMVGVPDDYKPDYSIISLSDVDNTTAGKLVNEENAKNSIKASVGLRYDNEELVAAQVGATYYFGNKLDKTLDLTLRLGKRTMGRLAWNMIPKPHRKIGLSYEIWHEGIDLYQGKHRSDAIKFIYQKANATLFSFDALNLNVDLGIAWEHYHHYDVLNSAYSVSEFLKNEYAEQRLQCQRIPEKRVLFQLPRPRPVQQRGPLVLHPHGYASRGLICVLYQQFCPVERPRRLQRGECPLAHDHAVDQHDPSAAHGIWPHAVRQRHSSYSDEHVRRQPRRHLLCPATAVLGLRALSCHGKECARCRSQGAAAPVQGALYHGQGPRRPTKQQTG